MDEQKYIPMHCICLILYDSILTIALLFASMAIACSIGIITFLGGVFTPEEKHLTSFGLPWWDGNAFLWWIL